MGFSYQRPTAAAIYDIWYGNYFPAIMATWSLRIAGTLLRLRPFILIVGDDQICAAKDCKTTKDLTAHTSDVLVNAPTVKMFAAEKEKRCIAKNYPPNCELRTHDWGIAARSGNWRIGFLLVSLLGLLLVFHSLGQHNLKTLTGGIFTFTYVQMLIMRLFEINTMTRQAEEAFLQAAPMTQIMQESPEVLDDAAAQPLKITDGKVDFSNVSFAYRDNNAEQVVFDNLELSIKPGEHVAWLAPVAAASLRSPVCCCALTM